MGGWVVTSRTVCDGTHQLGLGKLFEGCGPFCNERFNHVVHFLWRAKRTEVHVEQDPTTGSRCPGRILVQLFQELAVNFLAKRFSSKPFSAQVVDLLKGGCWRLLWPASGVVRVKFPNKHNITENNVA